MTKTLKLLLCTSMLALMGCGGDLLQPDPGQEAEEPQTQDPQAEDPETEDPQAEAPDPDYIFTVKPAEIRTINFSDFDFRNENGASEDELSSDFEDGTAVISSTGLAGNLGDDQVEVFIRDRDLVVVGPVNPVSDQNALPEEVFTLTAANGEEATVLIRTSNPDLGATVLDESHFGEGTLEEDIPSSPNIVLEGLEPTGAIGQTDFTLSLESGGAIDSDEFRAFIFAIDRDGSTVGTQEITSSVTLDDTDAKLTIDATSLQGFVAQLPEGSGGLEFIVAQGENFYNVYVKFYNGRAVLTGQLVDESSAAVTPDTSATGPLEVLIRGANTTYRNIVDVNTDGSFTVDNLPAGESYFLTVSDLRFPNLFSDLSAIFTNTTTASVEVLYTPATNTDTTTPKPSQGRGSPVQKLDFDPNDSTPKVIPQNYTPSSQGQFEAGRTLQNGTVGRKRIAPQNDASKSLSDPAVSSATQSAEVCGTDIEGGRRFDVESGSEGVSERCTIEFTPEDGVTALDVTVTVTTAEFPEFTQDQSEFDDAWSWDLSFANAEGDSSRSELDTVNNSHVSQGTTTEEFRVELREPDDEAADPLQLMASGAITSQNVGDSIFQTSVSVKITEAERELIINSAEFSTPNDRSRAIISPLKTPPRSNRAGQYISLPTTDAGNQVQVPLEIKYSPDDTQITEFTLSVVQNGSTLATSGNLIGNGVTAEDGKITARTFNIPTFTGLSRTNDNIQLSVQLKGTIEGENVETEEGENPISFNDTENLTPMFLAGGVISGRRFSGRDTTLPGNDSWAQSSLIDWLSGDNNLVFNDVSAQHVAQTSTGRSILSHSTHSDGLFVDIRYVQSNGTGSATNGATANQNRVNAAFTEFQANQVIQQMIDDAVAAGQPTTGIAAPVFTAQQELVNWISANRTLINTANTGAHAICVARSSSHSNRGDGSSSNPRPSDGTIGKALVSGRYSDNSNITNPNGGAEIGAWSTAGTVIRECNGHDTHFHIGRN